MMVVAHFFDESRIVVQSANEFVLLKQVFLGIFRFEPVFGQLFHGVIPVSIQPDRFATCGVYSSGAELGG
jgi:hypothetical protein